MDYNDLWKVTIVPSVTSQTASSNGAITSLTRTLSTVSERESKRDFCLPFDGGERKKDIYENIESSKITSLSPTCQNLSPDYLHSSFKSDKQLNSVLRENEKESHDRMKDETNKEDVYSQVPEDMSDAPFIELGAVYKILDFITDSDPKVASLTNNCCNEISRTLQCLLAQRHDKKLEDLLLNDSSLHRCDRCGVISYTLGSRPAIGKIKRSRRKTRHNDDIVTAERDSTNNDQNNRQSEILISSSNSITNARSRINDSKVNNNRTEYKDELSEVKLLPTKDFVMKRYIENSNEANNVSVMKANISDTINNKFYLDNEAIKTLFTDLKVERENKKYECNSAARNNLSKHDSSNAMKAHASSIDREKVMRKVSYGPKSKIDNLLARDQSFNIAQKIQVSQRLLDKYGDIHPVVDTVKYLARGQITELDKKEDELLLKLQENRYTRLDDMRNEQSSVLYGSREDYPQRGAGFWLLDKSGNLPQVALNEYRYSLMPEIDNNRRNVSLPANIPQYSHKAEKMNTGGWSNYMEKDSLEDCALSEQRRESIATIFSSSSVENLIHSLDKKCEINNIGEDISRGRKLVSSRPSLDIARHVRAQIAKDRHSDNAKESLRELCTHDSNVLVRLSPEIRRKICHLIETIVTSNKDSTFVHKKYLTSGKLNSEKLLHSKSADATFVHPNKCYGITNTCADDYIPTKLSALPEDKNRLLRRQHNFVNIRNQDLNRSKDSVKIFHENIIPASAGKSADKSTKKIIRQIVYKDASLKNVGNNDGQVAEILPTYYEILKNSEDMDWKNFQEFVEVLHPGEKELWREVCKTISEEARRISDDADDNTEICIEISPVNLKETLKTGKVITCAREIVFELDMTLKDVKNFSKKSLEERLDTHENAEDVTGATMGGGRRF